MLGGEHKRERISERLQGLHNQPRCRGYLPGCHARAPDADGATAYGVKTLQGNWAEERFDAAFYNGKAVLPTELQSTWTTTYGRMVDEGLQGRAWQQADLRQPELLDVVDGRHRCFPGHQPQVGPPDAVAMTTTTQTTLRNPRDVANQEMEFVPPVLGRAPNAQYWGVTLRLRQTLKRRRTSYTALRAALSAERTDQGGDALNGRELERGLQAAGAALSPAEVSVLVKALDRDGTGTVGVVDFVRAIRGPLSPRRRALVRRAFELISKCCRGSVRLRDVVRLYDVADIPAVALGRRTVAEARADFLAQWGPTTSDELIEVDEFEEYYADVSAHVGSEQEFELTIRNAWHISGGEGACRNTTCRRVKVVRLSGAVSVEEVRDDLGMTADDVEAMKANLHARGIDDILRIEV